jgi:cobalt-zinc-cadmium efflux system outer membrane protein
LAIAANTIGQAGTLLRLAQVTPIPNIDTLVVVQRDNTFFPGATTVNLQVGGEIPVFNRNRGNIIAAQAQLHRAEQTVDQVRNDLTGALADAFARYDYNNTTQQGAGKRR